LAVARRCGQRHVSEVRGFYSSGRNASSLSWPCRGRVRRRRLSFPYKRHRGLGAAISAKVSVENASDIAALEEGNGHFFCRGLDKNAEDVLSRNGMRLMLQAMSANGGDAPVSEQHGEPLQVAIASPKADVARNQLRRDYLSTAGRDVRGTVSFVHVIADDPRTELDVYLACHDFTSKATAALQLPVHCTRIGRGRGPALGIDNCEFERLLRRLPADWSGEGSCACEVSESHLPSRQATRGADCPGRFARLHRERDGEPSDARHSFRHQAYPQGITPPRRHLQGHNKEEE